MMILQSVSKLDEYFKKKFRLGMQEIKVYSSSNICPPIAGFTARRRHLPYTIGARRLAGNFANFQLRRVLLSIPHIEYGQLHHCSSMNTSNLLVAGRTARFVIGQRRHDPAIVDRYSTIRNFFLQQALRPNRDLTRIVVRRLTYSSYSIRAGQKDSWNISSLPFPLRRIHNSALRRQGEKSSNPNNSSTSKEHPKADTLGAEKGEGHHDNHGHKIPPPNYENYSRFFRRLAMSLPPMHRPTREDFLSLTTNVWQRLRVNFKWFTIKSFRKYDADEVSALFTWFLMSQTLWILIGT